MSTSRPPYNFATLLAATLVCTTCGGRAIGADCNSNGVDDQADLAVGASADCNSTGIPDECELFRRVVIESGPLVPFIGGDRLRFTLVSPSVSLGDVTIRLQAFADVSAAGEYATVSLDGNAIGTVFVTGAIDCPAVANQDVLVVTAPVFNAAAADGVVEIEIVATADVENLCSPAPFVDLAVEYNVFQDCNANRVPDDCEPDCNANGRPDDCDIDSETSPDEDNNGVPDECQLDCDSNGVPDVRDLADGVAQDCNGNAVPDQCDIVSGMAGDCNGNAIPDACELVAGTSADCDANAVPDECELDGQDLRVLFAQAPNPADGFFSDSACNDCGAADAQSLADNFILADRQYVFGVNLWGGYFPSSASPPVDDFSVIFHRSESGLPRADGLHAGTLVSTRAATGEALFFDGPEWRFEIRFDEPVPLSAGTWFIEVFNATPGTDASFVWEIGDVSTAGVSGLVYARQSPGQDWVRLRSVDAAFELLAGRPGDCNGNETPDVCDIQAATSVDCDENGEPDECQPDCNGNAVADPCDISSGASIDCNGNGVPDSCDLRAQDSVDCTNNGVPDECDIDRGLEADCNGNNVPDRCDVESGRSADCQLNGVPDECEVDSDRDGVIDDCAPVDDDDDGVPNEDDGCPNTPAGAVVDVNGCPVGAAGGGFGCGAGAAASLVLLAAGLPIARHWRRRQWWHS